MTQGPWEIIADHDGVEKRESYATGDVARTAWDAWRRDPKTFSLRMRNKGRTVRTWEREDG